MLQRRFRNDCGEMWTVRIDRQGVEGTLSGSELGGDAVRIRDGQLPIGLILSDEEYDKIAMIWLHETGHTLKPLPIHLALELAHQLL
jgi:hypothetical protein